MKINNSYQFCFDLQEYKTLKIFTPVAYIHDGLGKVTYLDKKASDIVLESLGIIKENLDADTQKLLQICEILKPSKIFEKHNSKVKAKSIEILLQNAVIKTAIKSFCIKKLDDFLQIIKQNQYPISLNLDLEKNFYKFELTVSKNQLIPKPHFVKTNEGLSYTLYLQDDTTIFQPINQKIDVLIENPAWIVIDRKLYSVSGFDSKKIMPFVNNKSIFVPTNSIIEYFQKIIKPFVNKVDIEATGFDVILKNKILKCYLSIEFDFFRKLYFINLLFDYDGYIFDYAKLKKEHSIIDDTESQNIRVIKFIRTIDENYFENQLINFGFVKTETNYFDYNLKSQNPYKSIEWVIEHKNEFEKAGFSFEKFEHNTTPYNTIMPKINQSKSMDNDWFDVKMILDFDEFQINFTEIVNNIKHKIQEFTLPNGKLFIIPVEWFSTYKSIVKFAKIIDDKLKIPKSNYIIINELVEEEVSIQNKLQFIATQNSNATLRPYQIEGVNWLLNHYNKGLGACLADDMGLGKTLQTLTVLNTVYESFESVETTSNFDLFHSETKISKPPLRALVVMPTSLIFNWFEETKKFTPHFKTLKYIGNKRKEFKLNNYDLIFTSYTTLHNDISVFEKIHFNYIILDESHYIKNRTSKSFKSVNGLKSEHKIALSGTPIENSLNDLWSLMEFLNPNILGSFNFFTQNFKIPIEKNKDEATINELKKLINPFILRRTKETVLQDLPAKIEQIVYCEMTPEQEKLYDAEKSKARNFLLKTEGLETNKLHILTQLQRLRQLSNHPKMIDKSSDIDSGKYFIVTNYLQTLVQSKKKVLIFSSYTSHLEFYTQWCKDNNIKYCKLTGDTNQENREQQVENFQNNTDSLLFFISLKAGGVGLNLTKASYILFLDPWWNPFVELQGIGRAYRIGQENKVNVIRFISRNTIEEKIIDLQESKKMLSSSLLEEHVVNKDLEENLEYLLS